ERAASANHESRLTNHESRITNHESRDSMPRADFYLIARPRFREQPLLLACELARKAVASGQALLVLAESRAQADALDELLWEFDPDAYVPHQVAGVDEDDDLAPVLIAAPDCDAPLRPLVLNLRPAAVPAG